MIVHRKRGRHDDTHMPSEKKGSTTYDCSNKHGIVRHYLTNNHAEIRVAMLAPKHCFVLHPSRTFITLLGLLELLQRPPANAKCRLHCTSLFKFPRTRILGRCKAQKPQRRRSNTRFRRRDEASAVAFWVFHQADLPDGQLRLNPVSRRRLRKQVILRGDAPSRLAILAARCSGYSVLWLQACLFPAFQSVFGLETVRFLRFF
jgi:hypothetical protein